MRLARPLWMACGALAVACASPGMPPGGPPDALPPELVAVTPDSAAVSVTPSRVVFSFNEVVSERPQGSATLGAAFIVSPRDGLPRVDWRRDRITVRPRRDWRPNTVYTVTMLPGISDLRGNVRREGSTLVFSTGPTIPDTRVEGIVFDWPGNRAAGGALVEALLVADTTLAYVTVADSSGRFTLPHLPPGRYVVRGVLDANSNRALDRREAFDSVALDVADSARVELLAFVHDTIGPRIATVTIRDSLTLRVAFDKPLEIGQPMDASRFRLIQLPDSSPVPIARALFARAADSLDRARTDSVQRADSIQRADSARRAGAARADTARPAPRQAPRPGLPAPGATPTAAADTAALRPSRPAPETDVVVVLSRALAPATTYRLSAIEVRNLLRVPRSSDRNFATPKPPAADTATARPDSLRPRPDSVRSPQAPPPGRRR